MNDKADDRKCPPPKGLRAVDALRIRRFTIAVRGVDSSPIRCIGRVTRRA